MLNIGNKTFMNLQEAVGWLLENNALPFQSTADYVANTEIAMSTLVNPSPAKVRVGSIIFFADSKVSTVIGVTSNSFIVSDQYNDLVDDVVYVSNVAINASGHLICTLSNGDTIDAGQIKQVSGFSINASQHLIASYNDGTSTDLGAIFTGNVNISGTLNATNITGDSIIENMSGYTIVKNEFTGLTNNYLYVGVSKTGNKVTLVIATKLTVTDAAFSAISRSIMYVAMPAAVLNKLYPTQIGGYNCVVYEKYLGISTTGSTFIDMPVYIEKGPTSLIVYLQKGTIDNLLANLNQEFYLRIETTFLLSENLAA